MAIAVGRCRRSHRLVRWPAVSSPHRPVYLVAAKPRQLRRSMATLAVAPSMSLGAVIPSARVPFLRLYSGAFAKSGTFQGDLPQDGSSVSWVRQPGNETLALRNILSRNHLQHTARHRRPGPRSGSWPFFPPHSPLLLTSTPGRPDSDHSEIGTRDLAPRRKDTSEIPTISGVLDSARRQAEDIQLKSAMPLVRGFAPDGLSVGFTDARQRDNLDRSGFVPGVCCCVRRHGTHLGNVGNPVEGEQH